MKRKLCFLGAFLATLTALTLFSGSVAQADGPEKAVLDKGILQDGMEVAPRGPIHEAFAQTVSLNPEPGPLVAKEPPALVPELPPEQKPEGDNVQWIPGYWAWDSDRSDFLWVSGLYRNMPPGRKYVPGYWAHTDEGFRWVPGYFASEQQAEVPLVPQPPASLENGPSIPAPDSNSFYTPGIWVFNGTEFVWRPGFWSAFRPDRIWINSCYVWTPGGYVFVNGYWDYPLVNRGLLFAPIYFSDPLWLRPGWFFRPRFVLGWGSPWWFNNFWWRPGWPNFFFGNFGGPAFARAGFRPWFAGPTWGNSMFNFYRWQNRGNPTWVAGVRNNFNNPGNRVAATPLNQIRSGLVNVSATQLNVQKTNIQQFRQISQTRNRLETAAAKQGNAVKTLNFNTGKTTVTPSRVNNLGANTVKSSTFSKGSSFTPKVGNTGTVSKQALTGQSNIRVQNNNINVNKNNVNKNNFNNNIYKGSSSSYQPKSGITGSQRQGTIQAQNFSKTINNYRTGSGSTYRPLTTQSYRPTTTYRPTTSYRPSSYSGYRGSSAGSRSVSGSRSGGGGRGGGGRR